MKKFITVHSFIYLAFAIALFFVPDQMWPLYGVEINDQYARFLSQHTSIFLGGVAAFGFMLRGVEESRDLYVRIAKSFAVTNFLGVVITLYAAVNGIFTGLGWSDPVFFALLLAVSLVQLKKVSEV